MNWGLDFTAYWQLSNNQAGLFVVLLSRIVTGLQTSRVLVPGAKPFNRKTSQTPTSKVLSATNVLADDSFLPSVGRWRKISVSVYKHPYRFSYSFVCNENLHEYSS